MKGKLYIMIVSIQSLSIDSIKVDNYELYKMYDFKYLGININSKNDMHIEINKQIASGNRCYFSIIIILAV